MELITYLLDLILHIDKHLLAFVSQYGAWIYPLLFAIVFCETGLVVMPLLPGDSLLFIAGAMCGLQQMDLLTTMALVWVAAVLGNQTNYTIGRHFGPRVFQWEGSRFFNRQAFDKAHAFYERYGGITLVAARFTPFLRTFAPFVAGVAAMTRRRFTFYDVLGGGLWAISLPLVGYFFGNLPFVQQHLEKIIWAMVLVPGIVVLVGVYRTR